MRLGQVLARDPKTARRHLFDRTVAGVAIGIELVANKDSKEGFAPDAESAMRVFKRCMNRGVVVRPIGNLLVISPPLTLSKEQCDKIITALYESIEEVSAEFRVAGLL